MRFRSSFVVVGLATQLFKDGNGVNAIDIPDKDTQCTGLHLDFSRLVDVTTDDLDMNLSDNMAAPRDILKGRSYGVNKVTPVNDFTSTECILQRHRLKETKNGVPIFGAEAIVTVRDCAAPDNTAFGGGYQQTPLSGIPVQSILGFEGKTYTAIKEAYGYVPSKTKEDAVAVLANHFDTPTDKVGTLEETIFPSFEEGDFLSYRSEVWVSKDSAVNLYDVFISAHTLKIIQICRKTSDRFPFSRRRHLRHLVVRENRDLQTETSLRCGSCASQATVVWSNVETTCLINSIYLNNTGRNATCLEGTVNGQKVLGPGVVSELHYAGTYDCNGRESNCNANALPTDCGDALSDVHYGVTESLKFYQKYLGVMGGLRVNGNDPVKFASFVHFGKDFCNAFFTTETNALYFGDCDCKFWTPLTSLDVAAHELTHGMYFAEGGCCGGSILYQFPHWKDFHGIRGYCSIKLTHLQRSTWGSK